jgi:putative hydrolase of HD superfamily
MKKKKENSRIKKLANFLFETRILKHTPRACSYYLKGPVKENIVEHLYFTTIIGWVLAKLENVDENKVIKMCLIKDVVETRRGPRNIIMRFYTPFHKEPEIIKEISEDHNLEFIQLENLFNEYFEHKTREAIVAKDADILARMLLEKECLDLGNQKAKKWLEYSFKRLETKSGRELGKTLIETDSDEWWLKIVERYTGYKVSLK